MARNTITLNGQSSASIAGLLIQELPPISKPAIRTETELIDGRDGDITTKLGYAAYDKEFTIGLYGDFDINAIIAFFNSEGTVVFSNEPDKYYNYEITDQIDFERLVRFRTAKVKMHCQPFKYSATEGDYILDPPADNLLEIPNFTQTTNGVTLTANNGTVNITGSPTAATEFYLPITSLALAAGSYTLSANASGKNPNYCSIRLIGSAPSDADSFGDRYIALAEGTVTLDATLAGSKTFGYLWFYVNPGQTFDFNATFEVENQAQKVASDEGTFLTLENSAEAPFSELTLKGDSFQQTYTGKNLVKVTATSQTIGNITFTVNNDGTIVVNGTNGNSVVALNLIGDDPIILPAGQYENSGCPDGGDNDTYRLDINNGTNANQTCYGTPKTFSLTSELTITNYRIRIAPNAVINNLVFKPMIRSASTGDSTFEPYTGSTPSQITPAPNPDYPQDIQVVTGEQTVKVVGKNLLNVPNGSITRNDTQLAVDSGQLTVKTVGAFTFGDVAFGVDAQLRSTSYNTYVSWGGTTLRAGTYTLSYHKISGSTTASRIRAGVYSRPVGDTGRLTHTIGTASMSGGDSSLTFTLEEDAEVNIVVDIHGSGSSTNLTFNLQLELGSVATAYEPYQGQTYPISLGLLELAKIGDYQDYLWTDGEKWYKHAALAEATFDGDEDWSIANSGTTQYYYQLANAAPGTLSTDNFETLLSNYERANTVYNTNSVQGVGVLASGLVRLRSGVEIALADWKAKLAATPMVLYYPLATPTDEEITNATLISQLNALAGASAYKGQTHIISTSGSSDNLPLIVAATVIKDSSGEVINSGNTTSKPKLTIYGSGDITVSLNDMQLFQIALGDTGYITIDTAAMEAYKDSTGNLQNRLVTGDYDNFALNPGSNTIAFTGEVTRCIVENYSRWI